MKFVFVFSLFFLLTFNYNLEAKNSIPKNESRTSKNKNKTVNNKKIKLQPAIETAKVAEPYVAIALADENGKILKEHNLEYVHPIASLTKMMTALIVIEKIDSGEISENDEATVPEEATKLGESSSGLKANEKISIEDLLKCAILKSGNDAAYTLAVHIGKTENEFIEMMNKKAVELGMNSTRFCSSTGLPPKYYKKAKIYPEDRDYDISTASDLVKLATEIIKHKRYTDISKEYMFKIRDGSSIQRSRNKLTNKYEDIDGLKTGYHLEAKYNIVASSIKDNKRLLAVVLGAPSVKEREEVTLELLNYGYEFYKLGELHMKVAKHK